MQIDITTKDEDVFGPFGSLDGGCSVEYYSPQSTSPLPPGYVGKNIVFKLRDDDQSPIEVVVKFEDTSSAADFFAMAADFSDKFDYKTPNSWQEFEKLLECSQQKLSAAQIFTNDISKFSDDFRETHLINYLAAVPQQIDHGALPTIFSAGCLKIADPHDGKTDNHKSSFELIESIKDKELTYVWVASRGLHEHPDLEPYRKFFDTSFSKLIKSNDADKVKIDWTRPDEMTAIIPLIDIDQNNPNTVRRTPLTVLVTPRALFTHTEESCGFLQQVKSDLEHSNGNGNQLSSIGSLLIFILNRGIQQNQRVLNSLSRRAIYYENKVILGPLTKSEHDNDLRLLRRAVRYLVRKSDEIKAVIEELDEFCELNEKFFGNRGSDRALRGTKTALESLLKNGADVQHSIEDIFKKQTDHVANKTGRILELLTYPVAFASVMIPVDFLFGKENHVAMGLSALFALGLCVYAKITGWRPWSDWRNSKQ